MTNNNYNPKPLILLDIDGVINDLNALYGHSRDWAIHEIVSHGHTVYIPDYMGWLVRKLTQVGDVHWCTTWRKRANDEIAEHLGIDTLPVVDDGTSSRFVDWKAAAAFELAATALADGRRVIWIEDFYNELPTNQMPDGVEFVDTACTDRDMVLRPEMLPEWLLDLFNSTPAGSSR